MASITYTISDTKLAEFKVGFLKLYPVPLMGDEEEPELPMMSEDEWIKERGRTWFISSYKRGKAMLHKEAEPELDVGDIVT